MASFIKNHRIMLLILLASLLIHSVLVPYAKFENETVRDLTITDRMLEQKEIRLQGLVSEIGEDGTQQSFGPLFYYLLTFSQIIWHHPYSVFILISVITAVAGFLTYLLVDKYYNRKAAIIASTLFMFNPWVFVFISLNIANPSFLLPFIVLLYYSLHKIIIDNNDKYIIGVGIALAASLQLHLSSLLLIPITFLILIILRPRVFVSKYFLVGLAMSVVFFLPYLIYNATHHTFSETTDFIFGERASVSRLENLRDSIGIPFMLATTFFGHYLLGSTEVFESSSIKNLFIAIDIFIGILIIIQIFILLYQLRFQTTKEQKKTLLLLAWFILPILFAIIPGANVSPHYLYLTYSSQFILLALLFTSQKHQSIKKIALGVILAAYILYLIAFFSLLHSYGGTNGLYGTPIGTKINLLKTINEEFPEGHLAFYNYVKPEYAYLQSYYAHHLTLIPHSNIQEGMRGYLILDFVSHGNFGEQHIPLEDIAIIKTLPSSSLCPLTLISLQDYVKAFPKC